MAKKWKVKKNKITGSNGNDNIKWEKSWKKAMIVNAKNGDDIINFKKSKYKNTLNGQAGNDTIYGGTNADTIDGGIGNDTVFGGNGDDRIYGGDGVDILYGEAGNDLIDGGMGNDTIFGGMGNDVLYGGAGNDYLYGEYGNNILDGGIGDDVIFGGAGNDLIFGGAGNDTINAGGGNNYIYINANGGNDVINKGSGSDTIVFSDEKNMKNTTLAYQGNDLIISNKSGNKVTLKDYANGHSAKTLQFQNYSVAIDKLLPKKETDINTWGTGSYDGTNKDEIINFNYASSGSGVYNIRLKEGNDTINFVGGGQRVGITFYAGQGDLTINGFENCDDSVNDDNMYLYVKSGNLTRDFYGTTLIWGQKNGNSLDIQLTNGEVLRFDSYFNFSVAAKSNVRYYLENETWRSYTLDNFVRVKQFNLTAESPNFNTNTNYSIVFADGDENHNIYINAGANNTIVTTGSGHDYIDIGQTTPGKNNQISVNGSGSKVVVDRGISTQIYVNNKDADATVYLYNNSSTLHSYAGTNTVTTKNEGWNEVYIHTADDAETKATATINTKGGDNIYTWGDVTVNMVDSLNLLDDDKMIHIMDLGLTTTIQHLHEMTHLKNDEAYIWYEYNDEVVSFEYSHYKDGQYVDVYAKDENGNRLDGVVKIDTTGGTFDAAATDDMIHFWNYNQDDIWLTSMDRYVDMNEVAYRTYEFGDAGEFTNIKPAHTNIYSTDADDRYYDYEVSGFGKTNIIDKGGDDKLQINETLSDIKFFIDFKKDGTLASNDLYIFNGTDMGKYFTKNAVTDCLCIKDYFTDDGKIENISVAYSYKLKDNLLDNLTDHLVADVQAWLTSHGDYGSVGEAIESGTINASAWGNLANTVYSKVTGSESANYWEAL